MLSYAFMQHAFLATAIVAVVAGTAGSFLVLRGQSFAGHALAHVGFTGATGAMLLGLPPLLGLVAVTVAAGACMGALEGGALEGGALQGRLSQGGVRRDVAVGMVLSLSLGLGLLFLHFFTSYAGQATALLFGNVLSIDTGTVWSLLALAVLCLAGLGLIARPLLFASLQPDLAEARGVQLRLVSVLFLALVAIATAECAQIVGVLLVFTLMTGPAATAQIVSTRLWKAIGLAVLLALVQAWGGLALAYATGWPTSFWITALSAAFFLAAQTLRRQAS